MVFPLKAFRQIKEFGTHVRLQARLKVASSPQTVDLYQSAGQVAVFHRRDASYNLHALNVVGRDGAHVHSRIGIVATGGSRLPCAADILHVGIGGDGCTVNHETGAQRRGGIIVAHRVGLTQPDGVDGIQHGVFALSAGQQFQ